MDGVSNLERKRKFDGKVDGPSPAKQAFKEFLSFPINYSGRKLINELNPRLKRPTIRARLILCNRGPVPSKKNSFLSLVFLDGSGEIRATIWRENLDLWQQRLIVNKVYDVSNFKVLESEQRYSRIRPGKYQINFDKWTKVKFYYFILNSICTIIHFCSVTLLATVN
jgi:hypothetical protein